MPRRRRDGLRMGPRHVPLNAVFMNGIVKGKDDWIPMASILGGQERCGLGWNKFEECHPEGRGVILTTGSIGAARTVMAGVGVYTRVREQCWVPIACVQVRARRVRASIDQSISEKGSAIGS
ncbi:hypothetical protein ACHAWF_004153 [Thalassiosira exigua]